MAATLPIYFGASADAAAASALLIRSTNRIIPKLPVIR